MPSNARTYSQSKRASSVRSRAALEREAHGRAGRGASVTPITVTYPTALVGATSRSRRSNEMRAEILELSSAVVDHSHWATVTREEVVAARMQLKRHAAPSDDAEHRRRSAATPSQRTLGGDYIPDDAPTTNEQMDPTGHGLSAARGGTRPRRPRVPLPGRHGRRRGPGLRRHRLHRRPEHHPRSAWPGAATVRMGNAFAAARTASGSTTPRPSPATTAPGRRPPPEPDPNPL